MKRFFILIPFLFYGIQPYNQNNGKVSQQIPTDSVQNISSIETDTMLLSYTSERLIQEQRELDELERYKKYLKLQLVLIDQKRKREEENFNKLKKTLEDFENRGL